MKTLKNETEIDNAFDAGLITDDDIMVYASVQTVLKIVKRQFDNDEISL